MRHSQHWQPPRRVGTPVARTLHSVRLVGDVVVMLLALGARSRPGRA